MLEFKKDNLKAVFVLIVPFALLLLFTFWPIINALRTSFLNDYTLLSKNNSIGIDNFIYIFSSPMFYSSLKNTALMVVISVPLTIIIGLLIAVGLNSIKKFQKVFQTVFFLPYVTNTIALGVVFKGLFSKFGFINSLFGIEHLWMSPGASYWSGFLVITLYSIWNGLAFKIIVFLSGLQSIDKQYYQAAQVDAASKWTTFRRITVPLLSPMILYITITSFIGAFKAYSSVIALFDGEMGPGKSKTYITIVGYIYDFFDGGGMQIGHASAASLILFIIILIITMLQFYVSKKRVHY